MHFTKSLVTYVFYLQIFFGLLSCAGPEPRRPVEVKSGSFIKESVTRSKALLAQEEERIQTIISKDSLHDYTHSANGSWYYYHIKNEDVDYTPKPDDLVTLTYTIEGFGNDTIYSEEEIGILTYKVDKQDVFPGLRHSVKLLKEGEKATFIFPSSLAYGYHGDNNKIGINVPVKSTLTILKIEKNKENNP